MNPRPPDLDDVLEAMLERRAGHPVPGWLFDTILSSTAETPQAARRFTLRDLLPTTPQTRVTWLAAMLALLVGAAIAASILGAPRDPILALVSPSPSVPLATPSQSASSSPSPSASATPSAPPTPLPQPDGLAANSIAVVTTAGDGLRVRSAPGLGADSVRLEPLLPAGTELFIVQGPVRADGYDWYEVLPSQLFPPYGWVAAADDSIEWIRPAPPACPSAFDSEALRARTPAVLLVCFGSRSITFDGLTGSPVGGHVPSCGYPVDEERSDCVSSPGWLAGPGGLVLDVMAPYSDVFGSVTVFVTAGYGIDTEELSRLPGGSQVSVTGAFDSPAAAECRITKDTEDGPDLVPPEVMVAVCRLRFVATEITWEALTIRPDSFAVVVTDDLRVRSAPGVGADSQRLEPLLQTGDDVFVVAGPISKDGYEWFQVRPTERWRKPFGWVAAASEDGEPWLAPGGLDCPEPGDWEAIAHESWFAGEHLACFGDGEIVADLWVRDLQPPHPEWTRGCDNQQNHGLPGTAMCVAEPSWLAGFSGLEVAPGDPPDSYMGLWVTFDPSEGLTRDRFPKEWTWMTVRGSYGHPKAETCRVVDSTTGEDLLDPAEARFYCRVVFVVTSMEPATRPG